MSLENICVVLAGPLYGGNIGSVCRAMKNMGLHRLRLAAPRASYDLAELKNMACHAFDLYASRQEFDGVAAAVADCGLVVGTTARPGLYREHARTPRAWCERLLTAAADTPVAILFGPEDRGLSNDELASCTQLIQIPTTPDYSSLNLAQAVLVVCYELFVASETFVPPQERTPEAPAGLRERMFAMWREALLEIGFMGADKADHMMLGLRRALARGPLSTADVKIIMGMARQTLWMARQRRAGGVLPPDLVTEPDGENLS